jgi:2'-5' RNA ligase
MPLRLFVAVTPAASPLQKAEEALERVRPLAPDAKWVKPTALHLTLAFLGDTEEARLSDVATAMDLAAARQPAPLQLSLAGGGGFGSPRAPRVLWVGVGGEVERLAALQGELAKELRARGFSLEERAFKAHLTLARARAPRGDRQLAACVEALQSFDGGSGPVERLELFHSTLTPQGSRYELKHASPLVAVDAV